MSAYGHVSKLAGDQIGNMKLHKKQDKDDVIERVIDNRDQISVYLKKTQVNELILIKAMFFKK